MPSQQNTINLIRTKTSTSPQFDAIENSLRRTGYVGIIVFICVGVLLGMIYFLFQLENTSLQNEKKELIARINNEKNKEGLLIAIKDRTAMVRKVMNNQKPWEQVLDLVATFVTPPLLSSITVDEQNKIVISMESDSLDAVLQTVNIIVGHTKENRIKNPQLLSFQVGKKGVVNLTISFFAVFN